MTWRPLIAWPWQEEGTPPFSSCTTLASNQQSAVNGGPGGGGGDGDDGGNLTPLSVLSAGADGGGWARQNFLLLTRDSRANPFRIDVSTLCGIRSVYFEVTVTKAAQV